MLLLRARLPNCKQERGQTFQKSVHPEMIIEAKIRTFTRGEVGRSFGRLEGGLQLSEPFPFPRHTLTV